MDTQSYFIAQLPLTPNHTETYPLTLTDSSKFGIFYYGHQPLQLTYTHEETIITNTEPQGLTKTQTQPPATQINCSWWVAYFGQWPIAENNIYCGQGIRDSDTETENEDRYFSGFQFDQEMNAWKCYWEKSSRQQVFNSTFEDSRRIKLVLNLLDGIGTYFEQVYHSTVS